MAAAFALKARPGGQRRLTARVTIDFASVAAGATSAATAVTGLTAQHDGGPAITAEIGDEILVAPIAPIAGGFCQGFVTGSGTADIFLCNHSTGAVDAASQDFLITITKQE
jgi:hypothetical protein